MADPRDTGNSLASQTNDVHQASLFKVEFKGIAVKDGYFASVTGFSSQTDVLEYAEGGQNTFVHRLPTRVKQGNITLKRGVISDSSLLDWYQKTVVEAKSVSLQITLLHIDTMRPVRVWNFIDAFPVKWTGSDLTAASTEFLTETLEVAHGGMTVEAIAA
jgi:phage tail-like protein